jgi:hypothetical protein
MPVHRNHVELRSSREPARQFVSETHDHKPDAPTRCNAKFTTAEKIETIVTSYLRGGVIGGKFGKLTLLAAGRFRVSADNVTVIVERPIYTRHWVVTFNGVSVTDESLAEAARSAIEGPVPYAVSPMLRHDKRIMFLCQCCDEYNPDGAVCHQDDIAVMPDGTWLCSECYSDGEPGAYGLVARDDGDGGLEFPDFAELPRPAVTVAVFRPTALAGATANG